MPDRRTLSATNVARFGEFRTTQPADTATLDRARQLLDEPTDNGDVHVVAAVLHHTGADEPVGVGSDDRRVRTVSDGLGADVTGTIGAVTRAVAECRPPTEGRSLVRRLDENGLHLTAQLREEAFRLVDAAAADRRDGDT